MIAVRMSIGVDFHIPNIFPKGAQTGIGARMKKQKPKKTKTGSDRTSQFFIHKNKKGTRLSRIPFLFVILGTCK